MEIQKEQMKIITVLSEQDFENLIYTVLDNEYELIKEISIESESEEDNQNENIAQAIKSLKSITEQMLENNQFSEIEKMVEIGLLVICKKMTSLFSVADLSFVTNS